MPRDHSAFVVPIVAAACLCASAAVAQPDYGIEFVTVGSPGNAAFTLVDRENWPNSPSLGHGAVDYEYRIGLGLMRARRRS